MVLGLSQGPVEIGRADSPHQRVIERFEKIADSPPTSLTKPWIMIELEGEGSPLIIEFEIGCSSITTSERANTVLVDLVEFYLVFYVRRQIMKLWLLMIFQALKF